MTSRSLQSVCWSSSSMSAMFFRGGIDVIVVYAHAADKIIDGNVEIIRDFDQLIEGRRRPAVFPAADCRLRHVELRRKVFLIDLCFVT